MAQLCTFPSVCSLEKGSADTPALSGDELSPERSAEARLQGAKGMVCRLRGDVGPVLPGDVLGNEASRGQHSWVRKQEEAYECGSRRLEVGVGLCSRGEVLIRTWSC